MIPDRLPESGLALVAIGTNVAFDGRAGPSLVEAALRTLEARGLRLIAVSECRQTEAWPDPADPPFTNAVALLHAPGQPAQAVLDTLLATERAFGRTRGRSNAPRTLDLDLLDFDGQIICAPGLALPHPRMATRRFVLEPLAEIWPDWVHPRSGETARALLAKLAGAA